MLLTTYLNIIRLPNFPMVALVDKDIKKFINLGFIKSKVKIDENQIQPSSFDLRVDDKIFVMPSSFLPINSNVEDFLKEASYEIIDINNGVILYPGNVYVVPILETLKLPTNVFAKANPKSSFGRIDLLTRIIANKLSHFDYLPKGYDGKLYLEIIPQSFPVKISKFVSFTQLRFFKNESNILNDKEIYGLNKKFPLLYDEDGNELNIKEYIHNNGVYLTVDVNHKLVGYKSKNASKFIDLIKKEYYEPDDYFEKVYAKDEKLILERGSFYILKTKENISIPIDYSCEIVPIEPTLSDLRSHYAGFFDPGFGNGGKKNMKGSPAILEVRTSDHNFMVQDGQRIARFEFVKNSSLPAKSYGAGSNYFLQQGIKLAKFFKSK